MKQLFADLAMPASLLIILFLFILFVIRPFFARLFDAERMREIQAQEIALQLAKKKREKALAEEERAAQTAKEFSFAYKPADENKTNNSVAGISSQGSVDFSERDIEKAKNMVKKWVQSDQ